LTFIKNFFNYVKVYSKYVDFTIVITYVLLSLIGLVMIYSASMVAASKSDMTGGNPSHYYTRQIASMILGYGIVFVMAYFMSGEFLRNKYFQMLATVAILLLLVVTVIFGTEVNGEKNWIRLDRKSTRLNSSHVSISYAVFCLKKKIKIILIIRTDQ